VRRLRLRAEGVSEKELKEFKDLLLTALNAQKYTVTANKPPVRVLTT
jgi:hypothetical protein